MKIHGIFTIIALAAPLFSSCTHDEEDSSVPESRVYFETYYDEYTKLRNPGTYLTFTTSSSRIYATNTYLGYGGLLIFRDFDSKIHCCDLTCPVEADRNTRVTVDNSMIATCPVCGSQFQLGWGLCTPISGPAKETLKIYTHCVDTGSCIRVSN